MDQFLECSAVGRGLQAPPGATLVNARGKLVLPGGVDPHTHFQFEFMNTTTVDDFQSGTEAAVAGGTTTIRVLISGLI